MSSVMPRAKHTRLGVIIEGPKRKGVLNRCWLRRLVELKMQICILSAFTYMREKIATAPVTWGRVTGAYGKIPNRQYRRRIGLIPRLSRANALGERCIFSKSYIKIMADG